MVVVRYEAALCGADRAPSRLPLFDRGEPGDIMLSAPEREAGRDLPPPACGRHPVDLSVRLLLSNLGSRHLPVVLGALLWGEVTQA